MKHLARFTFFLAGLLLLAGFNAPGARTNDGIFPPAPAAAPYINFDGRGFLVNGKRTFLVSGGMEYCRVPRLVARSPAAAETGGVQHGRNLQHVELPRAEKGTIQFLRRP
ncbi:MAG: hypothetical protein M3Y13_09660 [Armatimonadota bacterium]|nr:hypothetical protein [Armatimonadota bacterium]